MGGATLPLSEVAQAILRDVPDDQEEPTVPASAQSGPSVAAFVSTLAAQSHLEVDVKVEPRLVSKAAAGERAVYIADQRFGRREARRLAVHEVLGHMVAAANARLQPISLFK